MGRKPKRQTKRNRASTSVPHSVLRAPSSSQLVPLLLNWFTTNARDLPWRRTSDPYAIWVSEIMLQQTQVKTVIPYWKRWMRKLPTIKSAAKALPAKLHKLWEGLGYYTRVRNLQKAAQQIIVQHDGKFPENFRAVLDLPGIGHYTAGAICSIAFNQPTPILDGNVIRVLTRVYGITTNPSEKNTNARLWELAEELVTAALEKKTSKHDDRQPKLLPLPGERVGVRAVTHHSSQNFCSHLNQALMELGALICTPRSPNCAACPVQKFCVAFRESRQEQMPNLGKRAAATERRFIAFVVKRDGKFLVRQRPAGVVNGHLWEFPNVEAGARLCDPQHSAGKELGLKTTGTKPFRTIEHSITRYRITLEAWHAKLATTPNQIAGRWLTPKQLHQLAFTSAHKRILKTITDAKTQKPKKAST